MLTTYMLRNSDVNSLHISTLNNPTTDSLLVYSTTIRTNPVTNVAQVMLTSQVAIIIYS